MGKVSTIVIALLCLQGVICGPVSQEEDKDQALNAIINSANEFSFDLFLNLAKTKERENFMVSPMSSLLVLLMAYQGAEGKTAAEMQKLLHLSKDVLSVSATQQLVDNLNNVSSLVELHMANKIFINKAFNVRDTYEKLLDVYFRSASQSLNFDNPQQVVDTINNYCKEQTKDRVEGIISTDDLNQATAMVLVNALYFQGNWSEAFDHRKTHKLPFHDGVVEKLVPTMRKKSKFITGKVPQVDASFIQLPYKDEDLSMLIIIPNKNHDVSSVLTQFSNIQKRDELLALGENRLVLLDLPKFKFDTTMTLNDVLKNMGMVDAFTSNANFSKISENPVYISKVVQKSLINVNEQGSEAAAVTGIVGHRINIPSISPSSAIEFKVDRPFLFNIVYKKIVLFIGQVFQPDTMNH